MPEDVSAVQRDSVLPNEPPDEIGRPLVKLVREIAGRSDRKPDVLETDRVLVEPEVIN